MLIQINKTFILIQFAVINNPNLSNLKHQFIIKASKRRGT